MSVIKKYKEYSDAHKAAVNKAEVCLVRVQVSWNFSHPGDSSSIQQPHLESSLTGWMLDEPIFVSLKTSFSILHPASNIHQ
jgi:hypothetical protein